MDQIFKKYFVLIALFILTINNVSAQYPGTNLKGQIKYLDSNIKQHYPLGNAVVKLYNKSSEGKYVFMGETITNNNGFYFFYSIQPKNGEFYIQVNRTKNYQITVNQINYVNNKYNPNQFQDIPILNY